MGRYDGEDYDDDGPRDTLMKHEGKRRRPTPGDMNKTLNKGRGPIGEALEYLDDELAKLEELMAILVNKIEPVLGPDMSDSMPDGGRPDREPNSDVQESIDRKIRMVNILQQRLASTTERVEL
jgi:hypothetical protein